MNWNTLPTRAVLDSMRAAAGIHVDRVGRWFVVREDQRDIVWFMESEPAEACADELTMDAMDADVQHLAADLIASGLARGVVLP